MKKLAVICLSALMILSLSACRKSGQDKAKDTIAESGQEAYVLESKDIEENKESGTETSGFTEEGGGNILVAYFSVMETDGVDTKQCGRSGKRGCRLGGWLESERRIIIDRSLPVF